MRSSWSSPANGCRSVSPRRFPHYHEIVDPVARRAVVTLSLDGWSAKAIAGSLETSRATVYDILRRWAEEGWPGLADRPLGPRHPAHKVDLKAMAAVPAEGNRESFARCRSRSRRGQPDPAVPQVSGAPRSANWLPPRTREGRLRRAVRQRHRADDARLIGRDSAGGPVFLRERGQSIRLSPGWGVLDRSAAEPARTEPAGRQRRGRGAKYAAAVMGRLHGHHGLAPVGGVLGPG